MTEKRITKRDCFNTLLLISEVKSNSTLVDFINHELELLDKKNSNRKPSKAQVENEEIKNNIYEVILVKPMTISEITKAYNAKYNTEYASQKISALCHQLKEENKVIRIEEKKKVVFKRA